MRADCLPGYSLKGAGRHVELGDTPPVLKEVWEGGFGLVPVDLQTGEPLPEASVFPTGALVCFAQGPWAACRLQAPAVPWLVAFAPHPPSRGRSGVYELHRPLPGMGGCMVDISGCSRAETSTFQIDVGALATYQVLFSQPHPAHPSVFAVAIRG